jgi:alpha-beta hydrolase superfamily lysophospholipase
LRTSPSFVRRALVALALSTAAITGTVTSIVPVAEAQTTNPFQRGPTPTTASISATRGAFAISQTSVSNLSTPGFGAATIYYPTDTSQGTFGGVAIAPGFTATQSSISWLGPRLASQGFVVITIDTNSTLDQPSSRATQLMAALSYLTNTSSVRTRVDRNRLAVMGHSMGGGGTMEAATENPSLQAAIPLTGWHTTKNFSANRVPTLVVGAENDTIASVNSHSIPFYTSMSSTLDKAYLEINNGSHFTPNSPNTTIAKYSISWLKRFVDNDTRYEQFLCGAPHQADLAGGTISDYRETCPYS